MGRLEGKVAIISGAARGQGEAEARLFASEGAVVILADVLDGLGHKVAEDIGNAAHYVHLDVSNESDWEKAVRSAAELGLLRVLVNNAGISKPKAIEDTSLDDYLETIAINQIGTFLGIRSAISPMRQAGGGSIVNVASVAGVTSKNGLISYTASKYAVRGMTRTAALELGRYGIRVNCIVPGTIDTPMLSAEPEAKKAVAETFALGRLGRPEEVAAMALFLASEEGSYCTGADFVIDGGDLAGSFSPNLPRGGQRVAQS